MENDVEAEDQLTIHLENSLGLPEDRRGVTLAGFLISEKEPQVGGVKIALQREWRNIVHSDDVKIAWASPNVYVITVASAVMAKKLMEKGPWHVHDDVFSIQPWSSNCALAEIHPNKATYWIQAHGIPLGMMTGRNARLIGGRIGTVIGIEDPAINGTRSFLRMRIEIDSTKPLQLGFWLPRANGERTWINLRYEGLRRFCFRCGRLGHTNLVGKPCVHTLCPVVARLELKYGVGLAVRTTRGPSPLFPVKHSCNTNFSLLVTEELPGMRRVAEDDYGRSDPVPRQSAVSFRQSFDNANHVQLDGGQHAAMVPNEVLGLHPTVSNYYSNSMAIMTPAFSHSAPAKGQRREALGVMPTETNIESLNINSFLAPTPPLACVSKDLTHDVESENIHGAAGEVVAHHKPASLITEPDPTSDTVQHTQKKRGKKNSFPGGGNLPSKRKKFLPSLSSGCSLRLTRGTLGAKACAKGGRRRAQSSIGVTQSTINGSIRSEVAVNPSKECTTHNALDEAKMCEVVISPSKDLEILELRAKTGKVDGGGGWPSTATRGP